MALLLSMRVLPFSQLSLSLLASLHLLLPLLAAMVHRVVLVILSFGAAAFRPFALQVLGTPSWWLVLRCRCCPPFFLRRCPDS